MRGCASAIVACLLALLPAHAAVVYVDGGAGGADNGTSWGNAYTDLQMALGGASSGDELWVAEGEYRPTAGTDRTVSFTLIEGVAVYGGFAGNEATRGARNPTARPTILSGDIGVADDPSDNSYHVLVGISNATLDGFTICGGNADGSDPDSYGGGIYSYAVTGLTIANCTFTDNAALDGGGAICCTEQFAPFDAATTDCVFTDNTAANGGAIHCYFGYLTITGCRFADNTASLCGGAVVGDAAPLTATNNEFSGKEAHTWSGGAIEVSGLLSTFVCCTFFDNQAGDTGGALEIIADGDVVNCTFTRNVAGRSGGGIYGHWFWGRT